MLAMFLGASIPMMKQTDSAATARLPRRRRAGAAIRAEAAAPDGGMSRQGRRRVVVAGLGDSGVLTAIRLSGHADVVGISVKPALVSGQELGVRLSRPDAWARDY
jgi:hypothetical protein